MTSSSTATASFTKTHAARLASKVTADMYQCYAHYGRPSEVDIADYQAELVELLAGNFVETYEFGFKNSAGQRILSWKYRVVGGQLVGGRDDRSGGIYARASIATTSMFNFLEYSAAWSNLSEIQRLTIESRYDVNRVTGTSPTDGPGYWVVDRTYTAGGVAVARSTFRPS
jgi:hypothetical protein